MKKISQNTGDVFQGLAEINNTLDNIKKSVEAFSGMQIVNPTMQAGVDAGTKTKADFDYMTKVMEQVNITSIKSDEVRNSSEKFKNNLQRELNLVNESLQKQQGINMKANKIFNLKKYSQMEDQINELPPASDTPIGMEEGFPEEPEMTGEFSEEPEMMDINETGGFQDEFNFSDAHDLSVWMEDNDRETVENTVRQSISNEKDKELSSDLLKSFYESTETKQDKLEIASQLWKLLPDIFKKKSSTVSPDFMDAKYTNAFIKNVENSIKKQAEKDAKSNKVFNLSKFAQSKTIENVIMWGPEQTRIDPFLKQPISDWHIVERNKGFGLVLDDVWNIDWESIWRGTIMDKYSQPYRDKDGNWVGGYIQKRFEVDKWIPEENNMQLKPGQRRKPYLPQYRSLEARMEHERKNKDSNSVAKGETFDWHKANSNIFNLKEANKKKIASIDGIEKAYNAMERSIDGKAPKKIKPSYICVICGSNWAVDDDTLQPAAKCQCGADGTNMRPSPAKSEPDKKASSTFNLSKFSKRAKDSIYESDEIKMLDKASEEDKKDFLSDNTLLEEGTSGTQEEVDESAASLGIDG